MCTLARRAEDGSSDPGPLLLWQDTQGLVDPASASAAARKTGQSGRTLAASRASLGGTHSPSEEGAGPGRRVGPGCPRRRSASLGLSLPPCCPAHPGSRGWPAGLPRREERLRQCGWEPVPTLEAGPASRRAGSAPSHGRDLAKGQPRGSAPHCTGLAGRQLSPAGERGCGCSSDYRERCLVTGRSAAAGFHIPSRGSREGGSARISFFEPESPRL